MENSKIEWCDHTFNPWIGCAKVSPGCQHCYAEEMMDRRYGRVKWGVQGERVRTSAANWEKPFGWNRKAKVSGQRGRVFCASLADVFEDRSELREWRRDLVVMMEHTRYLDWLLLTKRPQNVMRLLQEAVSFDVAEWFAWMGRRVWIGASVENQAAADERIPALLEIPAGVRFLSCEPLLGSVNLEAYLYPHFAADDPRHYPRRNGVDWVIVGGESGHAARPMYPDWAGSIRDQCQAAGVPFLFKQWGEYAPVNDDTPMPMLDPKYGKASAALALVQPEGRVLQADDYLTKDTMAMWRAGKGAAGRLLDGREWDEMPEVAR